VKTRFLLKVNNFNEERKNKIDFNTTNVAMSSVK